MLFLIFSQFYRIMCACVCVSQHQFGDTISVFMRICVYIEAVRFNCKQQRFINSYASSIIFMGDFSVSLLLSLSQSYMSIYDVARLPCISLFTPHGLVCAFLFFLTPKQKNKNIVSNKIGISYILTRFTRYFQHEVEDKNTCAKITSHTHTHTHWAMISNDNSL